MHLGGRLVWKEIYREGDTDGRRLTLGIGLSERTNRQFAKWYMLCNGFLAL